MFSNIVSNLISPFQCYAYAAFKLIICTYIVDAIIHSLWSFPEQSKLLKDYMSAKQKYKRHGNYTHKLAFREAGAKIKPYLLHIEAAIRKKEKDALKEQFKIKGFLSFTSNAETSKQLKALANWLSKIP